MVQHDEGRKLVLKYTSRIVWTGPFLTLVCGLFLIGNPFQPAVIGLLAFCAVYLGIGLVAWRKLRRIASMHMLNAVAMVIPSVFTVLAAFRLTSGGPADLIVVLIAGYLMSYSCGAFWIVRKGLKPYLDGYYGKREVDLENGRIDLTNRAKMLTAFSSDRSGKSMTVYMSPQEKHWFTKWGWLIALLLAGLPIWRALNILYIDRMSTVSQNAYGIMIYYGIAAGAAFLAGANLAWTVLWRRWERENGKPMLIKYLA